MSLFIIGHMGLFFYTKISSIISIGDLPTTNIIEPENMGKLILVSAFVYRRIIKIIFFKFSDIL
ncbi:hypothetical protein TKY121527_15780 [Streptococcus pneumoniae]|nr:hypothetical protein TKY121527_15780 [Streptococcus pneumoniae]